MENPFLATNKEVDKNGAENPFTKKTSLGGEANPFLAASQSSQTINNNNNIAANLFGSTDNQKNPANENPFFVAQVSLINFSHH